MLGLLLRAIRSVVATALVCLLVGLALAPAASAATLFSDGFESANLSAWSVATATGGSAGARTQPVRSGAYAAVLSATSSAGSYAYARKVLSAAQTQVTAAADLRIDSAGTAGNVPLLRLYDANGTRLISLFRQNSDGDRLYVQHSGRYNLTTGTLRLATWGRFEVGVTTAGDSSMVVVRLNGTVIHQTSTAALGTAGVRTVQIGNDTAAQPFGVAADDVLVTSDPTGTSAPPPPAGTCNAAAPQPSNGDPGSLVVADNFESGLGNWTVNRSDATVATQSQVFQSGGCAARIKASASGSSLGNLTRAFPAGMREAWSEGMFNFEAQGVSTSWNAPTFRFFADGKRILDVSRQNGSGSLFVRYPNGSGGWTIIQTGLYPALKRWYRVKIHVLANWNSSTVEVWIDDAKWFATNYATLGTAKLSTQMVGAEHAGQEGTVAIDDVVVKARG